jgi:hypothetical protein
MLQDYYEYCLRFTSEEMTVAYFKILSLFQKQSYAYGTIMSLYLHG